MNEWRGDWTSDPIYGVSESMSNLVNPVLGPIIHIANVPLAALHLACSSVNVKEAWIRAKSFQSQKNYESDVFDLNK
jgi:hypothetical protein